MTIKKWYGTWPETCSNCGVDLSTKNMFYDARHRIFGWWGLFCHECWSTECVKPIGLGNGQCYDSKTLEKIGG